MIRPARINDLDDIDSIYNQAISRGFLTAHTKPLSAEKRQAWFREYQSQSYPLFVFEDRNKIWGWASLSAYRKGRQALSEVAEISFYVDFSRHGEGIGNKLVKHCIYKAPDLNLRVLFAIVIDGNRSSETLLKKFGFERWGYLPEVINYRNEIRGQIYMGKIL